MIDWRKPIEAYHSDGRVVAVKFEGVDEDGEYEVNPLGSLDEMDAYFFLEDGGHKEKPWHIRNVGTTWTPDERTVRACIERIVETGGLRSDIYAAKLTELLPVDPDLLEARRLIDALGSGCVDTALVAIKRGRELERGE